VPDQVDKTVVAIDYGNRRIGFAKSDSTGLIASALKTLEVRSDTEAIQAVAAVLAEIRPSAVAVGYPLLASGDRSEKCVEIDRFIDRLREVYAGPVYKVDEHGSSLEAAGIIHAHGKKVGRDKKRVDRLAAVVILQRFLDGLYEK
jgi:putative Holliday junction resolvase